MIDQYFGVDGAFAEASNLYTERALPQHIFLHSKTYEGAGVGYALGFAFAQVLHRRKMTITDTDLEAIAKMKIVSAPDAWRQFVEGFKVWKP